VDAPAKSPAEAQSDEHLIVDDVDRELKTLIQQSMQPGGGSQAVSFLWTTSVRRGHLTQRDASL